MIIEIEDGTKLELPDGSTPDQIDDVIGSYKQTAAPITKAAASKPGLARTVFDQGMQGATANFADEATSALAAIPVAIATGQSIPSAYRAGQALSKEQLGNQQEQRPITSLASQIGGGLVTGGAAASTKPGAMVANSLGSGMGKGGPLAQRALRLLAKTGIGGVTGAASGGLYGAGAADAGERINAAKSGAAIGGAIGAAVPAAGAALGAGVGAVLPKADEGLLEVGKLAQKYKIPVSVDELTSSRAVKNVQKISQELPLSGQAKFRDKQMEAFNRAITKSFGVDANRITPEVMDKAFKQVGAEFDNLGKGKTFVLDNNFSDNVAAILDDAAINSTDDAVKNFKKGLDRVYKNANPDGTISGEKLSFLRSNINGLARKANNPDTVELLKDLENAVIDVMTAGDDVAKEALSQAKYKYKNLLAIEPLAQKAKGGNISPTQLANRVSRIYGRQYTRGKAGELGDLARIGSELLPELGGSDTAQKLGYMAGTIGAGALDMGATAAGLGINRAGQALINRNPALVNKMIEKGAQKSLPAPTVQQLIGTP